jgi:CheY-like chemotaxis protein
MNPHPENRSALASQAVEKIDAPLESRPRIRILVVDDSRASADALSAYLLSGGFDVRTVYHGSDALREAKAWLPDCIVLDIAMPGLSGIGVAAALRGSEATENIPLLAFTAFDTADYIGDMKASGFSAICRKPAELAELESVIFRLANHESLDGSQSLPDT